jgi:hypothetical protein
MTGMKRIVIVVVLALAPSLGHAQGTKAKDVIAQAVKAMGGENYLNVKNTYSSGRYFSFDREGRKGYAAYMDWTVYKPVKSRFQMGEGKRRLVTIYNLELGKGWTLEGKDTIEDTKPEEIENFKKLVNRDWNILIRNRIDEDGMNLYYYGPDEVSGSGEVEAVEFLDSTNQSVIMYFDTKTHLPVKTETHVTDKMGIRHKEESEFFTWHTIQNVHTPLRIDTRIDGQVSQQNFVEKLEYNVSIPGDYFLEPKPEK